MLGERVAPQVCLLLAVQAPSLPGLLSALAQKLAAADDSALVQSLVLVVATLMHANLAQTVECLASLQLPGKCDRLL